MPSVDAEGSSGSGWRSWAQAGPVGTSIVLGSVVFVAATFFFFFDLIGGGAFSLLLLPVVLAGGLRGRHAGVAVALVMQVFSTYVAYRLGNGVGRSMAAGAVSTLPVLLLGYGVGRFRDLTLDLRRSHENAQREMAERKRLEEERRQLDLKLQEAQKMEALGILAGGIAHDFNNLLTGVLGNVGVVAEAVEPGTAAHEALADIEAASRRAADLAKQMLAYSGRGKFAVARVDLGALVRETCALARASISKKTRVTVDVEEGLPAVEADATEMHQVALNLIINAAEALEDGDGDVRVRVTSGSPEAAVRPTFHNGHELSDGPYVSVEVADTGIGVSEETKARMFDPFFSTKFAGRGLGLSAVLGIVRGHRGAIRVDSTPGRGTTVTVLLPVAEGAPSERPVEEALVAPAAAATGTVLVVDDEPMVLRVVNRILRQEGFTVLEAANGREALDLYRSKGDEIDVILLDMTMPVMDGEETLKALRALDPKAKVVLSSGFAEEEVVANLVAASAQGFLQKPYKQEGLLAEVRRVLEGPAPH